MKLLPIFSSFLYWLPKYERPIRRWLYKLYAIRNSCSAYIKMNGDCEWIPDSNEDSPDHQSGVLQYSTRRIYFHHVR